MQISDYLWMLFMWLILNGVGHEQSPVVPSALRLQGTEHMLQSFTVKKADTTTDVVYSLQNNSGDSVSYIDTTSQLSAPRIVKVSHQIKPIGSSGSDRHSVVAQSVVLDANQQPHIMSASLTWTIPRASVSTDTLSKDVLAALVNYLNLSGVRDALIDGIIP